MPWQYNYKKNPPPNNIVVEILCDDYAGEYITKARRLDYKKPAGKTSTVGWRWVNDEGERLDRKETPNAWRLIGDI